MEEDEDVLDLFADDSDPLFTDAGDKVNVKGCQPKQEQTSDTKPPTKPADEAAALAELPDYTPIEKDKSGNVEGSKVEVKEDANIVDDASQLKSKIDMSLDEVVQTNQKREERKRHRHNSDIQEVHGTTRGHKQKYMIKNGVQLCLRPRRDITELSPQEAGDDLARCLDEPKKILMSDTIRTVGLEMALDLLAETTKIQEDGGLITQDGNPKRPGGVFISLLKQRITDDQRKSIFERDRKLENQTKKKKKKRKVLEDREKAEKFKKRMDQELSNIERKRWNETKKSLPDIGLDKRYGLDVADLEDGEMMEVDVPELPTDNSKTDSNEFDNTQVTQPIKMEMTNGDNE